MGGVLKGHASFSHRTASRAACFDEQPGVHNGGIVILYAATAHKLRDF